MEANSGFDENLLVQSVSCAVLNLLTIETVFLISPCRKGKYRQEKNRRHPIIGYVVHETRPVEERVELIMDVVEIQRGQLQSQRHWRELDLGSGEQQATGLIWRQRKFYYSCSSSNCHYSPAIAVATGLLKPRLALVVITTFRRLLNTSQAARSTIFAGRRRAISGPGTSPAACSSETS